MSKTNIRHKEYDIGHVIHDIYTLRDVAATFEMLSPKGQKLVIETMESILLAEHSGKEVRDIAPFIN